MRRPRKKLKYVIEEVKKINENLARISTNLDLIATADFEKLEKIEALEKKPLYANPKKKKL